MRWLLSILAVLGLTGAVSLSAPGTACACSCAYTPDGPEIVEQVSHAASAFAGTAAAMRVDGDTAYYEFEVHEVFRGEVGATTVVSSSVQGSACGRGFEIGTEYLVFTSTYDTQGAPWAVESCSATTESSNTRTRDAAVTAFGPARPPERQVGDIGADDVGRPLWWGLGATVVVVWFVVLVVRQRHLAAEELSRRRLDPAE
ncbi:hypothetical protein ERC79_10230 [Rhodococcus sp. ABRD24]|uniref:hypothetical protein n=1 Tax=Rhodococcus sp. ABRD24 TaxID=2507582 RepID=UPI001039A51B|nr:hypothetical protein [Rhodococcus sp. ABRD24]QBJ96303.1 hypothetical protein ERC79_10230 [Rhodococcus sp. ABRD24]